MGENKESQYINIVNMMEGDGEENQTLIMKEEVPLTYKKIAELSFRLGIISIGGPDEQEKLIKDTIVNKNNHLTEETFGDILELCLLLPGYSSSNLLAALCTVNKKNVFGGLVAIFCFNLPSLIAIILCSIVIDLIEYNVRPRVSHYNPDAKYFNLHDEAFLFSLMALAAGIVQAALALLISSTFNISKKLSNSKFQLTLLLISGGIYYFGGSYILMIIIMIACGVLSIVKGDQDYLFGTTHSKDKTLKEIPFTGLMCLILFAFIFIFISTLNHIFNNDYTYLAESFLRMGAISIGEGHVIVPMILCEYKRLMEEAEVLNGYALVSLLPGSLLNIAAYSGVVISNIIGGIISGVMIFVPGFLFMLAALPTIKKIKSSTNFQFFIRGANSAAIGFIFSCTIKLWIDSCFVNKYTNEISGTLIVLLCIFLSNNFPIHKTNILLVGAILNLLEEVISYIIKSKSLKFRLF